MNDQATPNADVTPPGPGDDGAVELAWAFERCIVGGPHRNPKAVAIVYEEAQRVARKIRGLRQLQEPDEAASEFIFRLSKRNENRIGKDHEPAQVSPNKAVGYIARSMRHGLNTLRKTAKRGPTSTSEDLLEHAAGRATLGWSTSPGVLFPSAEVPLSDSRLAELSRCDAMAAAPLPKWLDRLPDHELFALVAEVKRSVGIGLDGGIPVDGPHTGALRTLACAAFFRSAERCHDGLKRGDARRNVRLIIDHIAKRLRREATYGELASAMELQGMKRYNYHKLNERSRDRFLTACRRDPDVPEDAFLAIAGFIQMSVRDRLPKGSP